jgi:Cft2 family RNA processing exonuclease
VRLTNLTRANEIGANSYVLDFGRDGTVLLDAGMHPKADGYAATPKFDAMNGAPVDAIFVTHAHQDHVGSLPLAMREHPKARVFMSEPTYFLSDPLLHNSVEIMTKMRTESGITEFPLFSHNEVNQMCHVWQACGLERPWSLEGYPDPDADEALTFSFSDAGHILGSVGISLHHRGRHVFYTGDVNFKDQTLCQAAQFPTEKIDTLMIETTRGAQATAGNYSRDAEIERFIAAILETFNKGGAVMVPIFAMGKTQETLALLHFLMKRGRLPVCPIYIGGLGRSFTHIYDKLAARSCRAHHNLNLLEDIRPQIIDGRTVNNQKPKRGHIYLISSGMMTERTLSNVFAEKFLNDDRHSIFFVGYCDPDSPAGRLRATPRGHSVRMNNEAGDQPVLCRVEHFDFTAHAQREDLLNYILKVNPRACVLVHGDRPALDWFKTTLGERAPRMNVMIPPPGQAVEV